MQVEINDLSELPIVAGQLVNVLPKGVVLVNGEMGAGKTTLISEICRQLGVADEPMSPTYPIINEYHSEKHGPVYHIDCYRLESEKEAVDIGMEDYLFSGQYCFIEWSENIRKLLPDNYVRVNVQARENIRLITIDQ